MPLEDRVTPTLAWDLGNSGVHVGHSTVSHTIGMSFTLNQSTAINAIGAYDANSNGFVGGSTPVGLWTSSGSLILSTTVTDADPGVSDFSGIFRFKATSLTLSPGNYVVGAFHESGFNAPGLNTAAAAPGFSTSTGARWNPSVPALTFPGPDGNAFMPGYYSVNFLVGPPDLFGSTSPVVVNEGQFVSRTGSFTGAGESFTLSANIGSVSHSFANAFNGTWSWSHTPSDGPTSSTVVITATGNSTGRTETISFPLNVANVAPTAAFQSGGPVNEGSSGMVSFSGVTDPSPVDAASLRYAYDFNNDLIFDFGDGTYGGSVTASSAVVPASFLASGPATRTVRGRIIDKDGGSTTYVTTVTVNNVAPTFEAGPNAALAPPAVGQFTRTGIQIADPGSLETYAGTVNFGDGTGLQPLAINQATRRFDLAHTYTNEGTYTVTVTVGDGTALSSDAFQVSVVLNTPPAVTSDQAAVSADEGGVAVNTGTFSDGQGNGTVGLTANIGQVTKNIAAGTWSWSLTAADGPAGPTNVTITATDSYGAAATTTFVYSVANVEPTISLSGAATVLEGLSYTLNLGAVSDPGADTITEYTIDWGDGTVDHLTGDPANTTAVHTYPDGPDNHTYEVRVTDEDGTFLAGQLNVQVLNVAPVIALTGPASVAEGSPYTLTLGAVTDPGLDTVTAYSIKWGDGTVEALTGNPAGTTATHVYADGPNIHTISVTLTDEDGTHADAGTLPVAVNNAAPALTVALTGVTVPEGQMATNTGTWSDPGQDTVSLVASVGTVTKNANGTWSWQLATDDGPAAGPQTVTVTATDSDGAITAVDFVLTVDNVAPTATFNAPATGAEGAPVTVSLTSPADQSAADTVVGFTYAFDFGTGYGAFGTSNTADFSPSDNGPHVVRGKVRDKDGGETEYTATVAVANVGPTVNAGADTTIAEGGTFAGAGAFADPGADLWTATVDYGDTSGVQPLALNPDRTFTLSHSYADNGTYTVTVVVTDDDGDAGSDTAIITVNNVAPTTPVDSNAAPNQVVENAANGTVVGVTAASTDPGVLDTVTYSLTTDAGGRFAIDSSTGVVTVANGALLDYETATSHDITVQASDGQAGTSTQSFTINLTNVTAVISGTVFVDVDGDTLFDGGTEIGINGVTVELLNGTGTAVLATNATEMGGVYAFTVDDELGTYRIREIQPTGVTDGAAILGSAAIDSVLSANEMQLTLAAANAFDYDFTEVGSSVQAGDTAGIGFWQNKHGQALISQGGAALVNWLNANFGNIFGTTFANGSGGDNAAEVASFYKNEFFTKKLHGTSKVDAQFMATALAAFFTSSNLSGDTVATNYGFNVTATGISTKVVNIGSSGAAFGVADNTNMTIMSLLLATNNLTGPSNNGAYRNVYDLNGDGVLDTAELALRAQANAIYTAINEGGDI